MRSLEQTSTDCNGSWVDAARIKEGTDSQGLRESESQGVGQRDPLGEDFRHLAWSCRKVVVLASVENTRAGRQRM